MNRLLLICQIEHPVAGVRKGAHGRVESRTFHPGEKVQGYEDHQANTGAGYIPVLKTTDGWSIPLQAVRTLRQEELAEAVEVTDQDLLSDKTRQKLNNLQSKMSKSPDELIAKQKQRSIYSARGAMIGAAIGLGYALMTKKNKLYGTLFGALIGGLTGQVLNNYKEKKDGTTLRQMEIS